MMNQIQKLELRESPEIVADVARFLHSRLRLIVKMKLEGCKDTEIGGRLGVSASRANALTTQAYEKMLRMIIQKKREGL